jgi:hypothetical protein
MPNKLAELTDQLNAKIRDIEKGLEALGLGVSASTPMMPTGLTKRFLEWKKHDGVWQLIVAFDGGAREPLLNTSREIRCAAIAVLPNLLEVMHTQETSNCEQVAEANVRATSFLAQLITGAGETRAE